jgi:hypothetical protein
MLLFRPEHIAPILAGTKTETRRIWKKQRVKVRSIQLAKTKMLSTEYFARLKIRYVKKQRLGAITMAEVQREGYSRKDEYLQKVCEINKIPYDPELEVFVVGFEVIS